ncbi:hypothetical protein NONO_c18080 [Nocardia nova SH22a]|uniref:Uncharacterized protein n=1 Tax=Nocardia nova SH22a TaxID=1415166 RepID=W5TCA1_9NOCA|nr:hypothetical protein [Nocardia nova]AHH16608.1 hypothetical protein NONO_c18080 [Nocardia nova SH22a]
MPGKLTPAVPETITLGGIDQTVVVIATAAPVAPGEGLRDWVGRALVERLAVSARVGVTVGDEQEVAVLRVHPSRVTDLAESGADYIEDLITLPADLLH